MAVHPEILPGVRCESYAQWFAGVWNSGPQKANRSEVFNLYSHWFKAAKVDMDKPFNFASMTSDPDGYDALAELVHTKCGPGSTCRGFMTYGPNAFAFYQPDPDVPTLKQLQRWFKIG